jgi:predicted peptidase
MGHLRFYAGIAASLLGLLSTPAAGQTVETGFLNRVVNVDGVEFRYQVYVPANFQRSTSWPVILALHGGGEYGDDGLKQTDGGIARAIRQNHTRFPALVVIPQSKADGTPGWQRAGGRAAMAALEQAVAELNGDRSRLYLTGLSAGGNGAWYLGSQNPERFAAMVVVCGWISERRGGTSGVAYPALVPTAVADPFATMATRLSKVPTWIFHGDADPVVSVEESRKMAAALKTLGADVQYTEFPGVDHNAWDPAYAREDLWAWLLRQRRH